MFAMKHKNPPSNRLSPILRAKIRYFTPKLKTSWTNFDITFRQSRCVSSDGPFSNFLSTFFLSLPLPPPPSTLSALFSSNCARISHINLFTFTLFLASCPCWMKRWRLSRKGVRLATEPMTYGQIRETQGELWEWRFNYSRDPLIESTR